ncbi:MAG: YigZ family protein, partial [Bacteroidetes bacterium]|nr:YigZ family protein [Bacteroidota bacterium]
MMDTYLVLASEARAELKVKGSRFIAVAIPVKNQKQADDAIRQIRKRDYGATHHSTAYRLGSNADVFRFNDDGEPAGSAGKPILRQIERRELINTLVVVTRYFGGTKLGTAGLIRAYGDAASLALDQARIQKVINGQGSRYLSTMQIRRLRCTRLNGSTLKSNRPATAIK